MPDSTLNNDYNFERFFNLSPVILCIAGYDGYFKKINPALPNLLGYSQEELMQVPIDDFIHEDDRKTTSSSRENVKNNIPIFNFTNRYVSKTGESVWLSWTSISEEENQLIYGVAQDITQLKKLEEERNILLLNLTRLNADIKKFTYMVSHDLRSPVNNVISIFGLLDLAKIKDEETREYVEFLNTSNLEMKQTLDLYIDALRTDRNINEEIEFLNLDTTLSSVKNTINELIKNSKAQFKVDFSKLTHLNFSKFFLQSIFLNLISNSLKFSSPNRGLIITISSHQLGDELQVIFRDNGVGFDMEKIGGNVFKLHRKFSNNSQSKGIGLYLVRNHMESLGGKIEVNSEIDVGTTFVLTFAPIL
ncbi:PAS domain-containing sensor histidine kinase [Gelidibacter salicanalis]|uniref:histidine kinase n=1 Tax=Gelidibacter salicanalis TaxID=291193 RepID=A0A934NJD0_9FLAO|nr:PAS domain-containing sensor histidine kinase [Gelidibacter salicanalis]MBJ7881189.1 PAS domain-containing sensor histidine kinase [Gelidibacter salicanalis]